MVLRIGWLGLRVKAGSDQKLGSGVPAMEGFSLPTRPEPSWMRILSSWSLQTMPLGKDKKPRFPASWPLPAAPGQKTEQMSYQ